MTRPSDELSSFFAAYFHRDWLLDDATPLEVVDRFASGWTSRPAKLLRIADEIDAFAAEHAHDPDLETRLFRALHCNYRPSADGLRTIDWLRTIAARLRAHASGNPP